MGANSADRHAYSPLIAPDKILIASNKFVALYYSKINWVLLTNKILEKINDMTDHMHLKFKRSLVDHLFLAFLQKLALQLKQLMIIPLSNLAQF